MKITQEEYWKLRELRCTSDGVLIYGDTFKLAEARNAKKGEKVIDIEAEVLPDIPLLNDTVSK